jgi:hypothetical protein
MTVKLWDVETGQEILSCPGCKTGWDGWPSVRTLTDRRPGHPRPALGGDAVDEAALLRLFVGRDPSGARAASSTGETHKPDAPGRRQRGGGTRHRPAGRPQPLPVELHLSPLSRMSSPALPMRMSSPSPPSRTSSPSSPRSTSSPVPPNTTLSPLPANRTSAPSPPDGMSSPARPAGRHCRCHRRPGTASRPAPARCCRCLVCRRRRPGR